jgi:hypothetical protein
VLDDLARVVLETHVRRIAVRLTALLRPWMPPCSMIPRSSRGDPDTRILSLSAR